MPCSHITLAQLRNAGACQVQRDLFYSMFGQQARVTEALCVEYAHQFDFAWAAQSRLLCSDARSAYTRILTPATAVFDTACDKARIVRNATIDAASSDFADDRITEGDYERIVNTAWSEFDAVAAKAWREYETAHASTFARAYLSQP